MRVTVFWTSREWPNLVRWHNCTLPLEENWASKSIILFIADEAMSFHEATQLSNELESLARDLDYIMRLRSGIQAHV